MSRYRISADIGGTFTDFVVMEAASRQAFTGKVLSTPQDPALAVLQGVRQLIPCPADIEFMVHGTTVGLNAFLERKGARVLLITTAGLRDSYTIARGDRAELYELRYRKPARLVPRRDVHEVRERIKWDGTVVEPLHAKGFQAIIEKVKREKIPALAVCFIHAHAYPQHELRAREILAEALPGVSITLSHEVAREWRENKYPIMTHEYGIRPDTGGPGRYLQGWTGLLAQTVELPLRRIAPTAVGAGKRVNGGVGGRGRSSESGPSSGIPQPVRP